MEYGGKKEQSVKWETGRIVDGGNVLWRLRLMDVVLLSSMFLNLGVQSPDIAYIPSVIRCVLGHLLASLVNLAKESLKNLPFQTLTLVNFRDQLSQLGDPLLLVILVSLLKL